MGRITTTVTSIHSAWRSWESSSYVDDATMNRDVENSVHSLTSAEKPPKNYQRVKTKPRFYKTHISREMRHKFCLIRLTLEVHRQLLKDNDGNERKEKYKKAADVR